MDERFRAICDRIGVILRFDRLSRPLLAVSPFQPRRFSARLLMFSTTLDFFARQFTDLSTGIPARAISAARAVRVVVAKE